MFADHAGLAIIVCGAAIGGAVALLLYGSDLAASSAIVLGLLIVTVLYAVRRVGVRLGGTRAIYLLLVSGVLVRYVGGWVRYAVERGPYAGRTDSLLYWELASRLVRDGLWEALPKSLDSGTQFIATLLALLRLTVGDAPWMIDNIFATLSIFGSLAIALAIADWLPTHRAALFPAIALFYTPTLFYWTTSLGKDSWIHFSLGIFILGATRMVRRAHAIDIAITFLGLSMIAVVRPHVAAIAAASLTAAFFVAVAGRAKSISRKSRAVGVLFFVLAMLGVMAFYLVTFLSLESTEDIAQALDHAEFISHGGAGGFVPTRISSPLDMPAAAVTVVTRPFPWEAHNLAALIASIEMWAILLLILGLASFSNPANASALASRHAKPLLILCVAYSSAFVVLYSVVANFGTLARMRAQLLVLLPFVILLCRHTRFRQRRSGHFETVLRRG